jgi:hypothetical protein
MCIYIEKGNAVVTIFFFQNDVWKPDLVLANSVRPYKSFGHETIKVENKNDGHIGWYLHEVRIFYYCPRIPYCFKSPDINCIVQYIMNTHAVYVIMV